MNLSPIVMFVYNRIDHTRKTIDALKKNNLAQKSKLFIFSDGPKNKSNLDSVSGVRKYIKTISGFQKVTIIERANNFGLANSIIDGVSDVLRNSERVIVLEDDMVTSPYFLKYMNEALGLYADDDRVISIHGYVYPVEQSLENPFFLKGADCWGWGTWKQGWKYFNSDGQFLMDELIRRKLVHSFNFNGSYPYSKMLKKQIAGLNDSWAIRWYASAFLAEKLTLYPGCSLVNNIGNDSSGTHCNETDGLDSKLCHSAINLSGLEVKHSWEARHAFEYFFMSQKRDLIVRVIKHIIMRVKGFIGG